MEKSGSTKDTEREDDDQDDQDYTHLETVHHELLDD